MEKQEGSVTSQVEFSVNMSCGNCEKNVGKALEKEGIKDFTIDLANQKVVVVTERSANQIQEVLETTGKTAVLVGSGHYGAAVAMMGEDGDYFSKGVQGVIRFTQIDKDRCVIDGTVDGLTPGFHGLAIHETGDTSEGCSNRLGGHYNPRGARHGSPEVADRHVGDLGNVEAGSDGRAIFRLTDKVVKVWDVIGRSVVVASGKDDLGQGNSAASLVDGNCGQGVACGIIARSAGVGQNQKMICACDGVSIWDERNKPLVGPGRRGDD